MTKKNKAKMVSNISTDELTSIVNKVLEEHTNVADDYRGGKENALQFLVGQVMCLTKGQSDPQDVIKLLQRLISK